MRLLGSWVGNPYAFKMDRNQWIFLYLFSLPLSVVMLQVVHYLQTFHGQVLLVAVMPRPASLVSQSVAPGVWLPGVSPCNMAVPLHTWSFSTPFSLFASQLK